MNQSARKYTPAGLTADVWKDPKFTKKARALIVEHGLVLREAATRMGISHQDMSAKAAAEGWLKERNLHPVRTTVAEAPKPVPTFQPAPSKPPAKSMGYDPLPGSKPRPFHEKGPKECGFILDHYRPGNMDTASTCCLPQAEDSAYCLGHLDRLNPNRHVPKAPKSRTPAHELARKLRRYL